MAVEDDSEAIMVYKMSIVSDAEGYLAAVNAWADIYVQEGLTGVVNFHFVQVPL